MLSQDLGENKTPEKKATQSCLFFCRAFSNIGKVAVKLSLWGWSKEYIESKAVCLPGVPTLSWEPKGPYPQSEDTVEVNPFSGLEANFPLFDGPGKLKS